jgi:type IX secretion system PorP/SprF family membrane protein
MKIVKLLVLLMMLHVTVLAQQRPHYTQYLQNMQVINPAVTGMFRALEIRGGVRNQWLGLESSPKTSYLTISTPINFDRDMLIAGSADYGVDEVRTRSDKNSYLSSENHHGLGATVLNDQTGSFGRASINLTYAYHLALGDIANLSVGVGAGVGRISLNANTLNFEDPFEPALAEGSTVKWIPDVNVGVYLYAHQFFLGASMQQVMKQKLVFNNNYEDGLEVSHYFINGGYRFWVTEDLSFTPSVMFKYIKPLPVGIDLNLRMSYRNNFWLGGSYRRKDSFSAIMGFTISKTLDAGYAYDITRSSLNTVSNGTHEIVIGLKL